MSNANDRVVVDEITVVNQEYVSRGGGPKVTPTDGINTKGILHFTIGVRDHIAAAKFYSEVLSCKHLRSNERYSFMECGGSYFVLAKIPHHVNPNYPDEDAHHHASLVEKDEFDRAMEILRVRGIRLVKYSDENHRSFPGRHAYFHDADGNCIEICYLYKDGEK
jgi:catechol 2,3-dioxygenase-like lactoylglutathione lyase family enzyme